MRASRSRIALFAVLCVLAVFIAVQANASTPSSGTIGDSPDPSSTSWTGPPATFPVPGPNPTNCQDEGDPTQYDHFTLTVDVTPDYWLTHAGGANIEIDWNTPADDFDLYVCQNGQDVKHSANGETTKEQVFIPSASGTYDVQVEYYQDVTGEGYTGTATFDTHEGSGGVLFDTSNPPTFQAATIVSAQFLGAEPQETIERPVLGGEPGAVNPNRMFVDWPLSSRTEIGQISRSLDGGNTFRLLLDLTCAERSRPDCTTGGGGDTEEDVNPYNGQLLFADQEVVVNEALASSTDHGDTFPVERQHSVTDVPDVDRQWIGVIDPSVVSVAGIPVEGFLAYHQPGTDQIIEGIGEDGTPIPQPVPQVPLVGQSGQMRVDNSNGPAHGWIYQPYRDFTSGAFEVATAYGPNHQDPTMWHVSQISTDSPTIFPWLALDNHGNAYTVWVTGGQVYMSTAPIDDKANDPSQGGIPGSYWTPEVNITPPGVGSTVFPEVIGGVVGRIAVAFDGTTDFTGVSDNAPDGTPWNTYAEVITNALGRNGPPVASVGIVNHRIIHYGSICTSGTTCTGDRSLLDMIDINYDTAGRVGVVYTDNNSDFATENPGDPTTSRSPFVHFAKELNGPSLLSGNPFVAGVVRTNSAPDPAGDATWPNTAAGANLPSLDILRAKLHVNGNSLVTSIKLADSSVAGMERDLAAYNAVTTTDPPAQRLQYVLRFDTLDNIYFTSMEVMADGTMRFFGGKMDSNDRILNPASGGAVAAGYNTDAGINVIGRINAQGAIVVRVPLADLGLSHGTPYYSATGLAFAGPTEQAETLATMMRTVDASPPFDGQL